MEKSQQYVDAFEKLGNVCTKTADFRGIFDYVLEPVYWDAGHTMSFGNKIIEFLNNNPLPSAEKTQSQKIERLRANVSFSNKISSSLKTNTLFKEK